MSNSLRPGESQHARPPCPSPTPGVYPNSCSSSRWCHPAISSSVVPFSSWPQFPLASGSFPVSQLFTWGVYWSFSLSISPSNEHPGLISFRIDWLDLLAVMGGIKKTEQEKEKTVDSMFSEQIRRWSVWATVLMVLRRPGVVSFALPGPFFPVTQEVETETICAWHG